MTTHELRPMLAKDLNWIVEGNVPLKFPFIGQPKIDGFRAIIYQGIPYSREGKLLTNPTALQIAQQIWEDTFDQNSVMQAPLDGEFVIGDPKDKKVFNTTQSLTGDLQDVDDLTYCLFDVIIPNMQADERMLYIEDGFEADNMWVVPYEYFDNLSAMYQYATRLTNQGYEGAIWRQADSLYKHGRCAQKDQCLIRHKHKQTMEGIIYGTYSLKKNFNDALISGIGMMKRSNVSANKVEVPQLGGLKVKCAENTWLPFNIGTGFTDEERETLWEQRNSLIGKKVEYEYTVAGSVDRPRHPSFKRIR